VKCEDWLGVSSFLEEQNDRLNNDGDNDEGSDSTHPKRKPHRHLVHKACKKKAPMNAILALIRAFPESACVADDDGNLPLHLALSCCNNAHHIDNTNSGADSQESSMIQTLLEMNPQAASTPNHDAELPIHIACIEEASLSTLKPLSHSYPQGLSATDNDGNLPLHWIFHAHSSIDILELFLTTNENTNGLKQPNNSGSLPLHRACVSCDVPYSIITHVLNAHPDGAAVQDRNGNLPLHLLVGRQSVTSMLAGNNGCLPSYLDLPQDANILARRNSYSNDENKRAGDTTVINSNVTTSTNLVSVIRDLINAYPNGPSIANLYGEIPLHRACVEETHVEVIVALIDAYPLGPSTAVLYNNETVEGDDDSPDKTSFSPEVLCVGTLPLHLACSYEASLDTILALLEAYPDAAGKTDTTGHLPLHCAVQNNASVEVIRALVKSYPEGAAVGTCKFHTKDSVAMRENHHHNNILIPLHYACTLGSSIDVIKILLEAYPDGAKNYDTKGYLPIHRCVELESSLDVVRLLLQYYPESECIGDGFSGGNFPLGYVQKGEKLQGTTPLDQIEEGEDDDVD